MACGAVVNELHILFLQVLDEVEAGYRLELPKVSAM